MSSPLKTLRGYKMAEEKGIKQLLELVAGVKEVALIGKEVLKDGKIGISDLAVLAKLLEKQQVLMDAFSGVGEISGEVKDLGADEVLEVVTALVLAAKEYKAA